MKISYFMMKSNTKMRSYLKADLFINNKPAPISTKSKLFYLRKVLNLLFSSTYSKRSSLKIYNNDGENIQERSQLSKVSNITGSYIRVNSLNDEIKKQKSPFFEDELKSFHSF